MFSVALSLALAAAAPALPVSTVVSDAAIAICFSPEEDCAAFAVRAIDNADHEILVGADDRFRNRRGPGPRQGTRR